MTTDREHILESTVSATLRAIETSIWMGPLTAAESRLAWLRVIEQMLSSIALDHQATVTAEWMGLSR